MSKNKRPDFFDALFNIINWENNTVNIFACRNKGNAITLVMNLLYSILP